MKMLKVPWNQDGAATMDLAATVASIFQGLSVPLKLWEILEFFLNILSI